jgi:hypothetical protein
MTIRLERTSALGKLVLTSQCIVVLAGPIFIAALNAPLKAQATTQQPLSSAMPDWQVAAVVFFARASALSISSVTN